MALPDWSPKTPSWSNDTFRLLMDIDTKILPNQTIENIVENSKKFPIKFPVSTGKCETLKNNVASDVLQININSVYPVIHENALELYCNFILFKRQYGSRIEKAFYQNLSLKVFIDRLLKKRAVMFMGKFDQYILLNGQKGSNNWETIGTEKEKSPLVLKDCISYDEIKCSVFLSVSSYTYFVNLGDRKNMAKYKEGRSKIADEGIIIGMIGPRLRKPNVMEYEEIVFTAKQNTQSNGYGATISNSVHKLFSEFYEEKCLSYKEVLDQRKSIQNGDKRYTVLQPDALFDNHYYYKRLTLSIDTLLMEANYRAKLKGTTAYIHVVGLGLGVWRISPHQEEVYMDTFAKRIKFLGKELGHISDICFAYINQHKCGDSGNGEVFVIKDHPSSGIKIHIFKREPHSKLEGQNQGKLLVVSYAWDGNALPGNEYWNGKLRSSGDSAAASSTQITELHNPHINPLVSADNLRVITKDTILPLKEYQELIRARRKRNLDESS